MTGTSANKSAAPTPQASPAISDPQAASIDHRPVAASRGGARR